MDFTFPRVTQPKNTVRLWTHTFPETLAVTGMLIRGVVRVVGAQQRGRGEHSERRGLPERERDRSASPVPLLVVRGGDLELVPRDLDRGDLERRAPPPGCHLAITVWEGEVPASTSPKLSRRGSTITPETTFTVSFTREGEGSAGSPEVRIFRTLVCFPHEHQGSEGVSFRGPGLPRGEVGFREAHPVAPAVADGPDGRSPGRVPGVAVRELRFEVLLLPGPPRSRAPAGRSRAWTSGTEPGRPLPSARAVAGGGPRRRASRPSARRGDRDTTGSWGAG